MTDQVEFSHLYEEAGEHLDDQVADDDPFGIHLPIITVGPSIASTSPCRGLPWRVLELCCCSD